VNVGTEAVGATSTSATPTRSSWISRCSSRTASRPAGAPFELRRVPRLSNSEQKARRLLALRPRFFVAIAPGHSRAFAVGTNEDPVSAAKPSKQALTNSSCRESRALIAETVPARERSRPVLRLGQIWVRFRSAVLTYVVSTGTNSCTAFPGEMMRRPRARSSPEFQTVCATPRGTNTKPPEVSEIWRSPSRNVASPCAT